MIEKNTTNALNQDEIQKYLKDLRKIPVMTHAREKEICELMISGKLSKEKKEKLEEELIHGNLRFVITIAKKYLNSGLELSDLIAEGNLGLLRALRSYDYSKGIRFISYSVHWIRQSILQALNDSGRTIRLPVNVVQNLHRAIKESDQTGNELDDKFQNMASTTALELPIDDEGNTLIDVLINQNASNPSEFEDFDEIRKERLLNIVNRLEERERKIIIDYFGLENFGVGKNLEEIGNSFSISKERTRQLRNKAVRQLRNYADDIFEYL